MLKKIAIGALLTGLVAVLIWGAVIRTNTVNGASAGETGRRGRTGDTVAADTATQGSGGGWSETTQGTTGRGGGNGGGRRAQGGTEEQAPAPLNGLPQADVQPDEWRTVQGMVVSATDDLVEIRIEAGELIPFEGQPLRFAVGQGFVLKVGDAVALSGFDEDGEFKLGQVSLVGGASITLRDASGRPGWAGQGRRG